MSRKGAKRQQPQAKPPAAPGPDAGSSSLFPMQVQIGDRFTDHGFEWEVLTRPAHMHGGKTVRVRIVRPSLPETERDMTWSAHERVEIRRGQRGPHRRADAAARCAAAGHGAGPTPNPLGDGGGISLSREALEDL